MLAVPRQLKGSMDGEVRTTVEQKNARNALMEQIQSLHKRNDAESQKEVKSEEWLVKASDKIHIKLVAKEMNTCEIVFYFNKEKIGFYTIENLSACRIYPYADIRCSDDDTRVFFDMSSSRFKSIIANEYSFQRGMYVEAENRIDPKRAKYELDEEVGEDSIISSCSSFIAPAVIEDINEFGELLIR